MSEERNDAHTSEGRGTESRLSALESSIANIQETLNVALLGQKAQSSSQGHVVPR